MVFATEFNPREQSQRRLRHQKARAQSALQTSTISLQEISALETSLKTTPKVAATSRAKVRSVVALQIGEPARRVRLDANATLSLPQQPQLPLRLRVLTRLQQGSAAATGLLVTAALVAYSSTVYIDKSTSKAIIQLDELQGESQQLTAANESIKQSLADQAILPGSGLEPYEAGDVLFVKPASRRPKLENTPSSTAPEPIKMPRPLGY